MKTGIRWVIASLFLFAAIGCYVFGAPIGGVIFLVLGALLEGVFWVLLFRKKQKTSHS